MKSRNISTVLHCLPGMAVFSVSLIVFLGSLTGCKDVQAYSNNLNYTSPAGKTGVLKSLQFPEGIQCTIAYWDTDNDDFQYTDSDGCRHYCSGPADFKEDK